MNDYRIITDSTSDLMPELIEELDITTVPLEFTIEEKTYKDHPTHRILPQKEFYRMIRAGSVAVTAQVNVADFIEVFEPHLAAGQDILYLGFSSGLSGTCNSAMMAAAELREKFPERKIICVDTLAASLGEGMLVYYAAIRRREQNLSIEELQAWVEQNRLKLAHWFTVDDLNHLKRGGRCSPSAAFFGTMLGIKPVLHVDDEGYLIPQEKVRGRKAAIDALLRKMEDTGTDLDGQTVFISHADVPEEAAQLGDAIRKRFKVKDVKIGYIGPVIGAHTGAGTIALFFFATGR